MSGAPDLMTALESSLIKAKERRLARTTRCDECHRETTGRLAYSECGASAAAAGLCPGILRPSPVTAGQTP